MPKTSAREQVTQHIQKLDESIRDTVQLLREIILNTDTEISEQIKWNNPAFYYNGEIKPFDPKEYKRDMIVFNLHKNRIMLVFPSGAKVNDQSGLLTGDYADGRRVVVLKDMQLVKEKAAGLRSVIKQWLKLVDK
jgi:hypothetical protein